MSSVKAASALQSVADIFKYQLECIRTGQYEYMGMIKKIVLEASAGANVPNKSRTEREGVALDWFETPMVPLAQTLDRTMLLALGPCARPDGRVGLPDAKLIDWAPPAWTAAEIGDPAKRDPAKDIAPREPQLLEDRATSRMKGTNFLVFAPVAQILFHPEGIADYWTVEGAAEQGGTQLALVVDRVTGETHFYGGRYAIKRPMNMSGR